MNLHDLSFQNRRIQTQKKSTPWPMLETKWGVGLRGCVVKKKSIYRVGSKYNNSKASCFPPMSVGTRVSQQSINLPLPYHDIIMKPATRKYEDEDEEEEGQEAKTRDRRGEGSPHEGRANSANVPPNTGLAVKSAPV